MNRVKLIYCALLGLVLAGSASATTLTSRFTSFWVLGDSLSAYVGETGAPETLRASNGPLWSERVISDFDDAGLEAQSFARGGATAGLGRDAPLDLAGQTDELLDVESTTDRFGDRPLVAIWIGGNDVRAFEDGLSPFTSRDAFQSTVNALIGVGIRDFLFFEVPDVGYTPLVRDILPVDPVDATLASAFLNSLFFDGVVAGLDKSINTTLIETFSLTRTAYEDPSFFGLDRRGPCVVPGAIVDDCTQTSFFDAFHPTDTLHAYVADQVNGAYAPVPLPAGGWLMMVGIGGLFAMRRRRASA